MLVTQCDLTTTTALVVENFTHTLISLESDTGQLVFLAKARQRLRFIEQLEWNVLNQGSVYKRTSLCTLSFYTQTDTTEELIHRSE